MNKSMPPLYPDKAKRQLKSFWRSPYGIAVLVVYFLFTASLLVPSVKALVPVDQFYKNIYGTTVGSDFRVFYTAGQLAGDGDFSTLYDSEGFDKVWRGNFAVDTPGRLHFSYPPVGLLLWQPLSNFPYMVAFSVWMGGAMILSLAICFLWTKSYLSLAVTACSPLFLYGMLTGNSGLVAAFLLAYGLHALDKKHYRISGVTFGLLIFKPHLAIALPFCLIAIRKWRVISSGLLTAISMAILSYFVFGGEAWSEYFGNFWQGLEAESPHNVARTVSSFTLWSIFLNMTDSKLIAGIVHAAGAVFAIYTLLYTWLNTQKTAPRLLTLIIFPAFISPYFHVYDAAPLIAVFILMIHEILYKDNPRLAVITAVTILVFGYTAFKMAMYEFFIIPVFFLFLLMSLGPALIEADKARA